MFVSPEPDPAAAEPEPAPDRVVDEPFADVLSLSFKLDEESESWRETVAEAPRFVGVVKSNSEFSPSADDSEVGVSWTLSGRFRRGGGIGGGLG
jgi:hypothetical protein